MSSVVEKVALCLVHLFAYLLREPWRMVQHSLRDEHFQSLNLEISSLALESRFLSQWLEREGKRNRGW